MEFWDIYDENKKPTGRTMKRNDWCLKDGEYHLTVLGVVGRPDGTFLITKRVMTKAWAPGWWEVSGGAAQAGEESCEAVLREGKDLTIIANGLCVAPALEAAEKLAADGIDAKVINIHTIKPLDEELVVAAAKETGKVVTVEEHSVIGGLGGAVCECLSEKAPVPVKRIGVNDVFGESGPATALLEKYGLDAEGIYKQIKEFV